jgi:hypothetical protein
MHLAYQQVVRNKIVQPAETDAMQTDLLIILKGQPYCNIKENVDKFRQACNMLKFADSPETAFSFE